MVYRGNGSNGLKIQSKAAPPVTLGGRRGREFKAGVSDRSSFFIKDSTDLSVLIN